MVRGIRLWLVLLFVTVFTGGGSILYLSHAAEESHGPAANEFPALSGTMSGDYANLAVNIVEHSVFSRSTTTPFTPDAWRTPGYPVFLAPFYALFGNFFPVLIAQVGILFLTVLLIFQMATRFMSRRWALALSILYLVLPTTTLAVASLLTETLFVFCFILALYLCFFSEWKHMYVRWTLAGLLLAAAAYIRPASLYILPFFLFGYFVLYLPWSTISRKHIIAAGLLSIMFVAGLFPWCYRNKQLFDQFSFASTGAFVLFRQFATAFYETYNDIPNLEARYILLERAGLPPGPVPGDFASAESLKKVAVEVITEHPFSYAFFHATTFIPFFTSSGAQNYWFFAQTLRPDFNPAPEPSLIQAIHPFSWTKLTVVLENHGWTLLENAFWGAISLLMLVGLWYSKDRRLAWMFLTLIFYFALVTGPMAHARYRMPVEPLILMIAFSGVAFLSENRVRLISRVVKTGS
ncbi:MAG TPA: glycosyltransferase family 39 protein [Candidatus Paceibacterota bacterium]